MITTIIKRDGRLEPFSAEKLNGWGEWAAKSLGNHFDWSSVVMKTVATLPETCSSETLQSALIRACLNMDSWSYNRMAGRLYAATMYKEIYGKDQVPTIRAVHQSLQDCGYMVALPYSEEEYAQLESVIKHKRDFKYAHFQLHHIRYKYALRNRLTGQEMESPQFVFMRMAMALGADQPLERRMADVKAWYDHFSLNRINAPTPNYVNLGTHLNGYASCCLYTTNDNAASLGVGDHIAYMMTVMSAGIGNNLKCRSIGDPVRGGLIKHQGKLPYYRAMVGAVRANMQNGRAGACTSFYNAFDPEVTSLALLKNQRTPQDRQIRGMDYAQIGNKLLGRYAAQEKDVFLFNCFTAPDLFQAFYSGDQTEFERLYAQYEADPNFKKTFIPARGIVLTALNEGYETGRAYLAFADEINRHTPANDPIYSSNLCVEIVEPTEGYQSMQDLYTAGPVGYVKFRDHREDLHQIFAADAYVVVRNGEYINITGIDLREGDDYVHDGGMSRVTNIIERKREPEVALCSLAGIVVTNIENDEQYADAMYYSLLMIDKCIHMSDYVLPHVGYTAKNRISAAVGMMDLAHHMARKKLKYSTPEGKSEIHRVAERHMYMAIEASLRLGKELGNAPWMHRTKWANGWSPLDTYNRNVDTKIVGLDTTLHYDWEDQKKRVRANGGIRNSFLVAYMPGESSSKASGTCNSIYPVREKTLIKTDGDLTTYWAAPESDRLGDHYESAWDVPTRDMIENYAIFQKFTDQSISADFFRRIEGSEKITTDEMIEDYIHMLRMGMKTRYYQNTRTSGNVSLSASEDVTVTDRLNDVSGVVLATEGLEARAVTEADWANAQADVGFSSAFNPENIPSGDVSDEGGVGCAGGFCTL